MIYADSMNAMTKWGAGLLAGLVLAVAASGGALAQQAGAAGSFVAVTGDVKILGDDGVSRAAAAGDALRQGDSIVTGSDGLARLRMTDGSALSVRTSSRFRLDRYRFQGRGDPDASFLVSIVQGGFRTVTGLIGRLRRDNYQVTTPMAAMGVRGTDFEIVHIERALPDAAPGTYNRVYEGVTALRNRAGVELLVSRGQTAFVALPGDLAPVLVAPPDSIFGESTAAPDPGPLSDREPEPGVASGAATSHVLINPIDSPTLAVSPALSAPVSASVGPIDASLSPTLTAPISATVDPTQTTLSASPTLASPVTTSVGPIDASLSPTLSAPISATVSPTLSSPTTVSVSPTVSVPVTTTVGPITTTLSPTLSAPITVTVPLAPIEAVTAPITGTIQNLTTTTGGLLGR